MKRKLMLRGLLHISLLVSLVATTRLLAHSPLSAAGPCNGPFISISQPLNDLGPNEYVHIFDGPTGFTGGLYPGGSNSRPAAHNAAGIAIAAQIVPLDTAGLPDPNGTIAMISVGMSNANFEFGVFELQAESDLTVNPQLAIINGAQSGKVTDDWIDPNAPTWGVVDGLLAAEGLTPSQVQVAWVKQTQSGVGSFPAKTLSIQNHLEIIARNLLIRYPNIKIAYYSSRTRSYDYAWTTGENLSPETVAFESGFAVKWMVEKQISGDSSLNYDPSNGPVVAPYLSWGPYLWVDGLNPRSDGMICTQMDLNSDCTHPSNSGKQKVAMQLMSFFKNDETTVAWFVAPAPFSYYLPLVSQPVQQSQARVSASTGEFAYPCSPSCSLIHGADH